MNHYFVRFSLVCLFALLSTFDVVVANINLSNYSRNPHNIPEINPLVPNALMVEETKWLLSALEKAHFKKLTIDDLNATKFLEKYLQNLDKQKLFFEQKDVSAIINRYKSTLLVYLKQGNLFPAFEIYDEYRSNALSRINNLLDNMPENIEIDQNNSFYIDRSEGNWATGEGDLKEVWSNVITNEFINECLSHVDENTSVDDLNYSSYYSSESTAKVEKKYQRWKKNILDFEASDVQELYLTTLTQMFDPHTSFLNIKEKERFDQAMHNEFVGIGAVLADEDGFCAIKELLPGGPAEASRELEPEDIILKVAQGEGEFVDVVDMKLSKIVDLIKGPKDTLVMLKVRPIKNPSSIKTVKIIRDRIQLTGNLASANIHQLDRGDDKLLLGSIELPSFYGSNGYGHKSTDDVEELILSLKGLGMKGLVLDLRRNGGGYLSEAINLAGLFISRGPVVQVKSSDGKVRKKFDFDPKLVWDGPLILLVSRYSASASEIVAGALKNHRRAIIVGDLATHGKGTVQSLLPMNIPIKPTGLGDKKSAAKITIQKYYLPSGETTQLTGVSSDIAMPSINQFLPIGESDLENALDWDKISEVNFRRPEDEFRFSSETLEHLSTKSLQRQNTETEFKYLRKNIDWFRKKRNQKNVVLNLKSRILEKSRDLNVSSELQDEYASLGEKSFLMKPLVLDVVKTLQQKSDVARGVDPKKQEQANTYEKPENLDIRLHESLRILADWVNLQDGSYISQNSKN